MTAYGPGLSYGNCNEPCDFKIVTKDAGTGGLAVAVEGPSKAEIQCRDNKNGTCDVVYYPTIPGDYTITVKFSDKHIVGSPFTAKIKDLDNQYKRNHVMYGNQSDISLKVNKYATIDIITINVQIIYYKNFKGDRRRCKWLTSDYPLTIRPRGAMFVKEVVERKFGYFFHSSWSWRAYS